MFVIEEYQTSEHNKSVNAPANVVTILKNDHNSIAIAGRATQISYEKSTRAAERDLQTFNSQASDESLRRTRRTVDPRAAETLGGWPPARSSNPVPSGSAGSFCSGDGRRPSAKSAGP
jgi:hypothetical protein